MNDFDISGSTITTDDGKVPGTKTADGNLAGWETKEWSRGRLKSIRNANTTSYNLQTDDEGSLLIHANAAASVINIPLDASLNWPVRGRVLIMRDGAGQITITALSGVTLKAAGRPKFRVQQSIVELIKIDANTWVLTGDTSAT